MKRVFKSDVILSSCRYYCIRRRRRRLLSYCRCFCSVVVVVFVVIVVVFIVLLIYLVLAISGEKGIIMINKCVEITIYIIK